MIRGYLGLGSNVGRQEENLQKAMAGLRERGVTVLAASSGYVTEPVGEVLDQPDFLNAALRFEADLEPMELLDVCKDLELELGRDPRAPRHSPRPVDIDILLIDGLELRDPRLEVPHPGVRGRRFVLVPLLELDPGLALPDGTRLDELLTELAPGQRVQISVERL